jgi:hypothetical protein
MRRLIARVTAANPVARYVAAGAALWAACAVYTVTQTNAMGTIFAYLSATASMLVGWM